MSNNPMFRLGVNNSNIFFLQSAWRRSFFVTLFFVTLAASLFWLDIFRGYQSEVHVLVISKVPSVATDQVVENFAELSKNLSFYERLLEGGDLVDDDFAGYSQDKRKKLWNETVQVERRDHSGVLVVTAEQESAEKAKRLSEETVKTLFAVASFYYNIKTDVDLRIVDQPITKPVIRHWPQYILVSLGSALGLSILFFSLLSVTPFFFGKPKVTPKPDFEIGESVPFIDPRKFVPARPTSLSFESSHEAQEGRAGKVTKAPAPVGLPTTQERLLPGMDVSELPFQFEETYAEETGEEASLTDLPVTSGLVAERVTKEEAVAPAVPKGEPSVEEYKRRLNELLSGGK